MKDSLKRTVKEHLKGDIKGYKEEAHEDRELLKLLKSHFSKRRSKKSSSKKSSSSMSKKDTRLIKEGKRENKIRDVMEEFKLGELHSGSKKGPKVKNPKQAIAIALSEARRKKRRK